MASIEEAIVALFDADATLQARFGSRVYDTVLPADGTVVQSYPALTFQVMDRRDTRHFLGTSKEQFVAVQFDTWGGGDAGTAIAARRNGAADVRTRLKTWSGTWGGVLIFRAYKDTDYDTTEDWSDGGPLPSFRNVQRWTVWLREP